MLCPKKSIVFKKMDLNVGGWVSGWLAGWLAVSVIILPLRGPSDKLRLARSSAKLKFSDGPSVAISSGGITVSVWHDYRCI